MERYLLQASTERENWFVATDTEAEIAKFLEEMNEIKAKIESLTDDQFIALDCANGTYSEILPKMAADYYNSDTDSYYAIAVM